MSEEKNLGNPYGAGRYGYVRSSEDSNAMLLGKEADFRPECNRWFEYMGCGYACWRDGKALQEADDIDLQTFHNDNPKIKCRESFYDFEYGNTRDEVSHGLAIFMEYDASKSRSFSLDLDNITMEEAKGYIAAMEDWHTCGEFKPGPFSFNPCWSPWQE